MIPFKDLNNEISKFRIHLKAVESRVNDEIKMRILKSYVDNLQYPVEIMNNWDMLLFDQENNSIFYMFINNFIFRVENNNQIENNIENIQECSDEYDTYGSYSVNNSSDESDAIMTNSQSKSKRMKNDHGSLKIGRFIIAKGGNI